MHDGRNEGAHNQRDADGDTDAEGHAEIAHGQAVADVPNSPHCAERSNAEQQCRPDGCIEAVKVGKKNEAHSDGEQNPREEAGNGPCRFPGPSLDSLNWRIKGRSHTGANNVPTNPGNNGHPFLSFAERSDSAPSRISQLNDVQKENYLNLESAVNVRARLCSRATKQPRD